MNTKQSQSQTNNRGNRVRKDNKKATKRSKNDATKSNNQTEAFYVTKIQQIASKWQSQLSMAAHRRISGLHPALVTYQLFLEILSNFKRQVRQQLQKSKASSKQIDTLEAFTKQLESFLEKSFEEVEKVVGMIPNTKLMENPKDQQNKSLFIKYQHEINQMEEIFNRKKNFKQYVQQHLINNKLYFENLIAERTGKVQSKLVDEKFMEYHRQKVQHEEQLETEWRENEKTQLMDIFKSMSNATKLKCKRDKLKRTDDIERELAIKANLCESMGSQGGYYLTLHQCINLI